MLEEGFPFLFRIPLGKQRDITRIHHFFLPDFTFLYIEKHSYFVSCSLFLKNIVFGFCVHGVNSFFTALCKFVQWL